MSLCVYKHISMIYSSAQVHSQFLSHRATNIYELAVSMMKHLVVNSAELLDPDVVVCCIGDCIPDMIYSEFRYFLLLFFLFCHLADGDKGQLL